MSRRVATVLFYAVVLVFLARAIRGLEWEEVLRTRVDAGLAALGLAAGLLQRFTFAPVWAALVGALGGKVSRYRALNLVYARAWLGRYAPGKVAMLAARVYLAEELGVARPVLLVSSFLEMVAQLLVTVAVGLAGVATLAGGFRAVPRDALALGAALGVLAAVLVPSVFNRLLRLAWRLLGRSGTDQPPVVPSRAVTVAVLGSAGVVASVGVYVNLLAAAVDARAAANPVFVLGACSLAGALGAVAPFAPTGLGVKEAVLVPLLALVVPAPQAVAIAVIVRLADVLIDVAFYGVSRALASPTAASPAP